MLRNMDVSVKITLLIGLVINLFIFLAFYQLTLAAWGSNKAKEKWVLIVDTPVMQLIKIKWLSAILACAMGFQLAIGILYFGVKLYTAS
jgi:hypothetical protein